MSNLNQIEIGRDAFDIEYLLIINSLGIPGMKCKTKNASNIVSNIKNIVLSLEVISLLKDNNVSTANAIKYCAPPKVITCSYTAAMHVNAMQNIRSGDCD